MAPSQPHPHQTDVGVQAHLQVSPAELYAPGADPEGKDTGEDELSRGPADPCHQHLETRDGAIRVASQDTFQTPLFR